MTDPENARWREQRRIELCGPDLPRVKRYKAGPGRPSKVTDALVGYMLDEIAGGKYFREVDLPFSRWSLHRYARKHPNLWDFLVMARACRKEWKATLRRWGMKRHRDRRQERFRNTGNGGRSPRRPSKYRPEMCELVASTPYGAAKMLGVDVHTVYLWVKKHPEFSEALLASVHEAAMLRLRIELGGLEQEMRAAGMIRG